MFDASGSVAVAASGRAQFYVGPFPYRTKEARHALLLLELVDAAIVTGHPQHVWHETAYTPPQTGPRAHSGTAHIYKVLCERMCIRII